MKKISVAISESDYRKLKLLSSRTSMSSYVRRALHERLYPQLTAEAETENSKMPGVFVLVILSFACLGLIYGVSTLVASIGNAIQYIKGIF